MFRLKEPGLARTVFTELVILFMKERRFSPPVSSEGILYTVNSIWYEFDHFCFQLLHLQNDEPDFAISFLSCVRCSANYKLIAGPIETKQSIMSFHCLFSVQGVR